MPVVILRLIFLFCLFPGLGSASPAACIEDLYEFGRQYPLTRFDRGSETRTWVSENQNGEPGETISWTEKIIGAGRVITYKCPSCSPSSSIFELALKPTQSFPCEFREGMAVDEIVSRLGNPAEIENGQLLYLYPPIEQNQEIYITLKKGRLSTMLWRFYLD